MTYSSSITGRNFERLIPGIPRGLEIIEPESIAGSPVFVKALFGASRVEGLRVEIALTPTGAAIHTSLDRLPVEGEAAFSWAFTDVSRDVTPLWVRVIYWTDPRKPHTALRRVDVVPIQALGARWDDTTFWDDTTIWTDAGDPDIEPPVIVIGRRWDDTERWDDASIWID